MKRIALQLVKSKRNTGNVHNIVQNSQQQQQQQQYEVVYPRLNGNQKFFLRNKTGAMTGIASVVALMSTHHYSRTSLCKEAQIFERDSAKILNDFEVQSKQFFQGTKSNKTDHNNKNNSNTQGDSSSSSSSSSSNTTTENELSPGKEAIIHRGLPKKWSSWLMYITQHFVRVLELMVIFSPSIITSPLLLLPFDSTSHYWRRILLVSLEWGGPTWVKLAQWASTRADIFSKQCREDLAILHDRVGNEQRSSTLATLEEAFGQPVHEIFASVDFQNPIGAGCIAQVYRGKLAKDGSDVAIKVRRRGVARQIRMDLDFMVFAARNLEYFIPPLRWFDLLNGALCFGEFLESQLDLREEGRHSEQFSKNFEGNPRIRFPTPIAATETVLIESYCEGTPLNVFLELIAREELAIVEAHDEESDDQDDSLNSSTSALKSAKDSKILARDALIELRKKVAIEGVRSFLQMVLIDNFVHSDLHSGNILILTQPPLNEVLDIIEQEGIVTSSKEKKNQSNHEDDANRNNNNNNNNDHDDEENIQASEFQKGKDEDIAQMERLNRIRSIEFKEFVILDAGLVTVLTPQDQINFLDLFKAVANGDGELAGRLMIDRSRPKKDPVTGWPEGSVNPEGYIEGMKKVVEKVKLDSFRLDKVQIGSILEQILALVHKHHILVDTSFTSLVVAIVVLEGIGRQLDPTMNIFKESFPILARADEKYRDAAVEVAMKKGKDKMKNWLKKQESRRL